MSEAIDFVIGIRFTRMGKIYHFKANNDRDLDIGDTVLVETSRGYQFGTVVQHIEDLSELEHPNVKSIIRKANEEDLAAQEKWLAKEAEALERARSLIPTRGENAVKVVHTEYGYLGESLNVLVSAANDNKVNLNPIRNRLANAFPNTTVNIRQVGPRDVAKLYGGIGACGIPERCCTQFLEGFNSISIRMAKEQEISLTPEEITGMCGRLRCCLNYEYEQYREGRKGLPKKGKWVETPEGAGRVTVVLPLRGSVLVNFSGGSLREFNGDEVTVTANPRKNEPALRSSYQRNNKPTNRSEDDYEESIPESQLEELNAESVDINSQTTPVTLEERKSRNSGNHNRSNRGSGPRQRRPRKNQSDNDNKK